MAHTRVTLTLDRKLVEQARRLSDGNFSRFVSQLIEERLEALHRQQLREALRAGYAAEAELDLEIACEYQFAENESTHRSEV
jgi:hypothetical protein